MSNISKLCSWYKSKWVEDLHEDAGISIDTLDNPGWSFKVDLKNTYLETKVFSDLKIDRTEHDWVHARRTSVLFEAFGGPLNLDEMISVFLSWAEHGDAM